MQYIIFSDIHEDQQPLRRLIEEGELSKQSKRFICLGDIVGFCVPYNMNFFKNRSANKCINLLQQVNAVAVVGNHDLNAIKKLPENSPFSFPKNWYSKPYHEQKNLSNNHIWLYDDELPAQLSKSSKEYLEGLSEFHVENNLMFSHFLYPDVVGSCKHKQPDLKSLIMSHFKFTKDKKCSISFVGHLHVPRPILISNEGFTNLSLNQEFNLDTKKSYIIFCPPLLRTDENESHFINFDNEKNIISYQKVST